MTKLLWQTEARKRWLLDDGREVDVFNDYDRCLKCGRPLSDKFSRSVGRGHKCRFNSQNRNGVKIVLAISFSNIACSGQVAGAGKSDGESTPSATCHLQR